MLIIGERINTSRKRVAQAVRQRDADFIAREAKEQVAAGAHYIDVNAGTSPDREVEDLVWLVEVVQQAVDVPLALDSTNPQALSEALQRHRGQAMINSISGERERLQRILPLVVEHGALVVALAMGDGGMPETTEDRLRVVEELLREVEAAGVPWERVYIDPLVRSVGTEPTQAARAVETIRRLKSLSPDLKTIAGVSNVSFGLPRRNLLNRAYIAILVEAGLDAAIIDPTEPGMMAAVLAAEVLAGRDEFALNYIAAAREGRLDG